MRRVTLVSLMLIMLAACGVAEQPTSAPSPVNQSAQTNAYPTPVGATAVPTSTLPTATIAPTVVASATPVPQQLNISLAKTLTLQPLTGPHYLVGWSPDDAEILYIQGGDVPHTNEVYVINAETGNQALIEPQAFGGRQGTQGFYSDYAAPQWAEQCCQVLLGKYKANGKQELVQIDRKTKQQQSRGEVDYGIVVYEPNDNRIVVNERGIQQTKGKQPKIDLPDLKNVDVLLTVKANNHGKVAFQPTPSQLTILDITDPTKGWKIKASDFEQKTAMDKDLISLRNLKFQNVRWSPDGSKIAFLLASGAFQELWMMESDGTHQQAIHRVEMAWGSNVAWSPDNTMIALTKTATGTNPKTQLYVVNVQTKVSRLVDSDVYTNAVWNSTGTQLAVYDIDTNAIRLYMIEQ